MGKNKPCNITTEQVVANRAQITIEALQVRFMNLGQTAVWIDESIFLEPGESYIEGDLQGCGIEHTYKINFYTVTSPPTVKAKQVYANNMLFIRKFKRPAA